MKQMTSDQGTSLTRALWAWQYARTAVAVLREVVALLIKSACLSVGLSLERVRGSLDGVNNITESFSDKINSRQIFVLVDFSFK